MRKILKNIFIRQGIISTSLVFAITLMSCEKNEFSDQLEIDNPAYDSKMLILGDQIPNAYTIDNMTQAYINISKSSKKSSVVLNTPLKPTHYYVRFLPKSEQELALLYNDTTLILFDFPIDYEILGNGTYYHDPSLPDSAITWQYCTVEIGYVFPDLEYEIMEELYLTRFKK